MVKKEPYPSSLFNCVEPSMITTRNAAKWKSEKPILHARNFLPDDMGIFLQQDSINDFNYFHPGASYTIQTSANIVSDLERWS